MPKTGLANNFRSLLYDFTSRTLRATAQHKALGTIATNDSFAINVNYGISCKPSEYEQISLVLFSSRIKIKT